MVYALQFRSNRIATHRPLGGMLFRLWRRHNKHRGRYRFRHTPTDDINTGNPDVVERTIYENDSLGRVTRVSIDENNDTVFDSIVEISYGANGRETTRVTQDVSGGTPDIVLTRIYDSNDRWFGSELDRDSDVEVDSRSTNIFNEDGELIRQEFDNDLDGVTDNTTLFMIGTNGEDVEVAVDIGSDGTPDRVTSFEYERGRFVLSQFDQPWGSVCLP